MEELKLRLIVRDLDIEVGKLVWEFGPAGVPEYEIDKLIELNDKEGTFVMFSGLQYYGYGSFLILLEVGNSYHGANFFLLDTNTVDFKSGGVHYLEEIGGYKEFNELARKYIDELY